MTKTAVVLFNLGGPDQLSSVQRFLFNLFSDPAIISLPQPLRWLVAQMASRRRAPFAQDIYRKMGGGSPILEQTNAQAQALEERLGDEHQVFVAMRYWHPLTEKTVADVAMYAPDRIVLLPLYPQFSTTTTGSSVTAWKKAAKSAGLTCLTTTICCYPIEPAFIEAHAQVLDTALREAISGFGTDPSLVKVLFSAHGLPKRVIARGDPYDWQVEQTAAAVAERLAGAPFNWGNLDWSVCYQSRVGPLEWIGPSTEDEIVIAAKAGKHLVVTPIAFVSEHSETLVELDIEYRDVALENGAGGYVRAPALGVHNEFINGLVDLVNRTGTRTPSNDVYSAIEECHCPSSRSQCLQQSRVGNKGS
jgi:protoporphyrin/coproporphyrin ferrochelatase